jgi:hypothetical protein
MKVDFRIIPLAGLTASLLLLGTTLVNAQEPERRFMVEPKQGEAPAAAPAAQGPAVLACNGPITKVIDVAFENVKTTSAVYGVPAGGGQGGQFDKTPVLSAKVTLAERTCLNAHFSVIVGSGQLYGKSRMALFQVTVTPAGGGGPRAMVGHYPTPFGVTPPGPAVAIEAERDVDMLAANFFQKVGSGPHEVPPGAYVVDVWWAGAPPGSATPSGAIGMAFVLKLYLR